jgi:hypothetical protein
VGNANSIKDGGNSDRLGRIDDLLFKEANPASLQTRMIYIVAYKVVKTSCMDLVAGHLEPTKAG